MINECKTCNELNDNQKQLCPSCLRKEAKRFKMITTWIGTRSVVVLH